jgi:thymidylate synthase
MQIDGESLDEILFRLYEAIAAYGLPHKGSRGDTRELLGVSLRIRKPRARISRSENRGKPFSAIGELLWYLSGSDALEFIEPYVPAYAKDAVDGKLEGAYGPRLVAMRGNIDQFDTVTRLLTEKPGSRRAVIQIFNAEDISAAHKEIPCTTTMQFHLRDKRLHMSATLRSNDAYLGLPHDVFCFTMIQEMVARRLGAELGEYFHYAGSMHIYDCHLDALHEYHQEGFQQAAEMPPMPYEDPFTRIKQLLAIESRLRSGESFTASEEIAEPYWADIVRLLQVFWEAKLNPDCLCRLKHLRKEFIAPTYHSYVDARMQIKQRRLQLKTPSSN